MTQKPMKRYKIFLKLLKTLKDNNFAYIMGAELWAENSYSISCFTTAR